MGGATAHHHRRTNQTSMTQQKILEMLELRYTQKKIAVAYAELIRAEQGKLIEKPDWGRINKAIQARWEGKNSLIIVKEMAWKYIEDRGW